MKIIQFVYSISPGGAERFAVDLSNELANNGNEVYLCVLLDDTIQQFGFYKSEVSKKVVYRNLKIKAGFNLSNIFFLRKILHEIKPDVVHCHQNLVNYFFPISILNRRIKFYHTIHSDPPKEVSNKFEYWLRRLFYGTKMVNAITISKETSKSFVNYYRTKKFTLIYNGRKTPSPSENFEKVKKIIDDIRIGSKTIFLHVGRCVPVKNQKMLVNVFNRLVKEGWLISLLMIGEGFDSIIGKELKSIASSNIKFLDPVHNIADFFLNSDAFCLSSSYEGMPITIIEALACGCTPICTPVGGIVDTIENGVTGFLSESTSEEDYYQSVTSFLKQENKIKKEKLIKIYNKRFSIEECVNLHIKLYQR